MCGVRAPVKEEMPGVGWRWGFAARVGACFRCFRYAFVNWARCLDPALSFALVHSVPPLATPGFHLNSLHLGFSAVYPL